MREVGIYIIGKIGDVTPEKEKWNVERLMEFTEDICRKKDEWKEKGILISCYPTAYTGRWKDKCGYAATDFYEVDNVQLKKQDVACVRPEGVETSVGARSEIALCTGLGIPVKIGHYELWAWLNSLVS